jgi:riboflavin synthase
MFTGLVEDVGEVLSIGRSATGGELLVKTSLDDISVGDSVAVNGACLTVVSVGNGKVSFEVSPETFSRTNLSFLKPGDPVNLERALRADSRLGGHFVLGHVDFTARILSFKPMGQHRELVLEIPPGQELLFVEKGSVAVDGISLTVNYVRGSSLYINIIPHTFESTNLKGRKTGDLLNIETDIIGKYVLRYLSSGKESFEDKLKDLF